MERIHRTAILNKNSSHLKIKAFGKDHLLSILKYRHNKTKTKRETLNKEEQSLEYIIKNSEVE